MNNDIKTIPINYEFEQMLISALRYALGRSTYITSLTVDYISKYVSDLSSNPLIVMQRDLRNELDRPYERYGLSMVDSSTWFRLLERVEKELDKRGYFVG